MDVLVYSNKLEYSLFNCKKSICLAISNSRVSNLCLLDLPEAEYIQFERIGSTILLALNDGNFSTCPQPANGISFIREKPIGVRSISVYSFNI
jgi:hypothetical protein